MIYGYARCSTNESKQDINRQVRELKAAGAEQIFLEYEHGDSKIKSQQRAMLEQAQAGDSIITLEVPRLARSTQQLCEIIDIVSAKHLRLQIIGSITLDCRNGQADPMSEAFFTNGRGIQSVGAFHDTRPRPLWNGKCKSQRKADREAADHRRGYTAYLLPPLPRLCRWKSERQRISAGMQFKPYNGL